MNDVIDRDQRKLKILENRLKKKGWGALQFITSAEVVMFRGTHKEGQNLRFSSNQSKHTMEVLLQGMLLVRQVHNRRHGALQGLASFLFPDAADEDSKELFLELFAV